MQQSYAETFSAVCASLERSHDAVDDGVTHGRQAWLRGRSVDSFFPASLGGGDDVEGTRKRSLSSARVGGGRARIAPRSERARVLLSSAGGPVHKSIAP